MQHRRVSAIRLSFTQLAVGCWLPIGLAQWEPDRKLSTTDSAASLNENMGRCIFTCSDTVHVIWCHAKNNGSAIYYKRTMTGNVGIEEDLKPRGPNHKPLPTIVRGVLRTADGPSASPSWLLDAAGRKVMALKSGLNDVSKLSPGLYFVREEPQASSHKQQDVRKVIVAG